MAQPVSRPALARPKSSARALVRASALALSFALVNSQTAWAQSPAEPSTSRQADAAFEEGRDLFDQGRFREACEKFELSLQLEPSPGTLLNLGNCYEARGDLVLALATFERALQSAKAATDPVKRKLWTEAAPERISSLNERVPLVSVRGVQAGSTATLDGEAIRLSNSPLRVNPGRHMLEIKRAGQPAEPRPFDVVAGQKLTIDLAALASPSPAPAHDAVPAEPVPSESPPAEPSPEGEKQFGVWPFVLGGTGAALVLVSLIPGLSAQSKKDELKEACPSMMDCNPALEDKWNSAKNLALASDILWISGAVIAGVGVTLFVLDAGKSESTVQAGCFDLGCGVLAQGKF
jgi:tetratricopeptide (TPR) repeat protein